MQSEEEFIELDQTKSLSTQSVSAQVIALLKSRVLLGPKILFSINFFVASWRNIGRVKSRGGGIALSISIV